MWLDLIDYVAKAFKDARVAKSIIIGGINPTQTEPDEKGVIILMRGEEEPSNERIVNGLSVTLFLEAWVREDDPDVQKGYVRLSALEERIDEVLTQIRTDVGTLENTMINDKYQLVDIRVTERVGDSDSLRPLLGSQYTIKAIIYDVTEEEGIW